MAVAEKPVGEAEDRHDDSIGEALERFEGGRDITQAARYQFDPAQVAAIKRTVAKDCDDDEFVMFMELVARYKLDPFARQIWATKMSGQDGQKGGVTIIVGRDGFLAIANRNSDFRGIESGVVRENDQFSKDAREAVPQHIAKNHRDGGEIVGAWATVYRDGRRPFYYYAPWEDYAPEKPGYRSPWKRHPSAMIKKCAEANALRIAYSISGLVDETEMESVVTAVVEDPEPDYGSDPELAERLRKGFEVLGYRPAKVRMELFGKDDDERRLLADRLDAEAESLAQSVGREDQPPEAEVVREGD